MTWNEAPAKPATATPHVIGNRASRRLYQTAVIGGTFRTFSNDTKKQIEDGMRRIATVVAAAFGATAKVDFPDMWAQLVNDPVETQSIVAVELVGRVARRSE